MLPIISKLTPNAVNKFQQLLKVFEEAFEMKSFSIPEKEYLGELLMLPEFIVMTAEVDDKVVGGLSAYVLPQYYSAAKHAYIHDVAISTPYQRKGIGKQLITSFNEYCKSMGYEEVFVAAEKEDEQAVAFYHSTGGEALESVHFFYKLNSNRP